ncbi:MAG TPA: DUF2341 domain-containing protein, partial [Gemmatimonadota bacterium]|nr:DUF2341 domain-containing protein [Gemmatimonadota bacterium]
MRFSNPPVAARSRARRMALVVAAALCIGAMPVDALGQGWYDSNWSYRKKITIDNTMVAGNLTNFPVLLDFTDTDLRDKARNDGFDILFTADDGTTKLDHDIESYTGSSGALVVWVEVTSLSGSVDTDIYMYYGYASATNQEAEAATWSDSYVAVYHLHDDFNDASGNQGAATNSGSADVSGIAGDGQNFVKSQGDYIDTNWAPSSFTGDYTFEGWFRALGQTGSGDLIGVEDRGTGDDSEVRLAIRDRDSNGSADGYDVELRADGGDIISSDGALPGDPDDGSWHHLAIVREGTSGRVYYDGVWITLPDSATSSGTASFPSPRTILLGAQWNTDAGGPPATRNRINADLDELRIHTKMRTQPFFATQVANVNNSSPGGFYDLPDPEENPPVGGTVLLIVGNGSIPDQADQDLKSYLEGRGLTVYYADDTDGTASFQQDIDTLGVDVVYVSQTVSSSNLSPTKPLTAGVVMANSGNWKDEALVAHDNEDVATTIQIVDNSHFITQEYSLGSVTIYSSSGARGFGDMGFGPDAQILATTGTSGEATLVVYEQGGELEDGSFAVNRRVGIWEEEPNFDIYTADNLNMVYRALLWGGSLDAGGSGGTNAVTSATAEISPNDVQTNSAGVEFVYAILATIGGTDTGVDSVEIAVPASFGLPTLDSVRVSGTLATITDNTSGRTISFNLSTKLTSTDSIQAYFTADAPTSSDATGQIFPSTVDDKSTPELPQGTIEGSADGDAGDANSWRVTTSGAVSSATAEISPNEVMTRSTGVQFIYAILATIGGDDSGVDEVEITVPTEFGLPTVDSVRVGGTAVTYTDNTGGTRTISLVLDTKLTSTDSIQVYFTSDAPSATDATGKNFTSTIDDTGDSWTATATTEGSADGDGADANDWTVTTSGAVTSATAEISPNDVYTSTTGNEYIYAILATISGDDSGVDRVEITVPATHGLPTVDSVRVGGTVVTYTDNTGGTRTISLDLTAKVTATDSIQVYFTADAPTTADGGVNFTSTVDDTGDSWSATSTTEGSADGDASDSNSWTVTTTDSPATLLVRYWIDEAPSGQSITELIDDAASPLNMPLTYVSSSPTWEGDNGGQRNLR